MLATEVKGLSARDCDADPWPAFGDPGGSGWRIHIASVNRVIPMRFARQKDAQAAMVAIADVVDWTGDTEQLRSVKWTDLRDRMLAAMAW